MNNRKELIQGLFLGMIVLLLCLTSYSLGEKHGSAKLAMYEQSQSLRQEFIAETLKLATAGDDPDFKMGEKFEAVALNTITNNDKQRFNAKIISGKYLGATLSGEALVDPMGMVLVRFTSLTFKGEIIRIRALGVQEDGQKNQEISFSFNGMPMTTGMKITVLML